MGILLSAMAGAGDSGADSVDKRLAQQRQMDLDANRSELEKQKQLSIIQATKQAQIDTANQLRDAQVARLGAAKDAAVNEQMDKKYAQSDEAVAAADAGQTAAPLTAEQKAAIAQSKAIDLKSLADDPHTYIAAAMKTGDITPEKVAELAQQADSIRRQELAQQAQFAHADKAQAAQMAHAEQLQRQSQAFQAGQEDKRLKAMYGTGSDIGDSEKEIWMKTFIMNGGMPRSAPAVVRNNIGTWLAQKGITPEDIQTGHAQAKFDQSAATTSGHRAGSMAAVEAAMPALADNAVSLSKKLDQGRFVPLNKLSQMASDSISDPDLAAFKVAHQALASEYQQVIARGGTNVTALKEAMHVLDSAKSPEAYEAAANQVKREVAINVAAMNKVRAGMGGNHGAHVVDNPTSGPKIGDIDNGYRFKGGDPGNAANWEKI
jgi:hypothetical protein